jgi:uncharacterized membrane protein
MYLTPQFVEQEVNGKSLKFYAVSFGAAAKLRSIGKPLAKALSTLFGGVGQETGMKTTKRTHVSQEGDTGNEVVEEFTPIAPALAEIKVRERERAFADAIESIMDPASMAVVAELVMDCLRDDCPRNPDKKTVTEFTSKLDLRAFVQLLKGVGAANKDVLDPLLGQEHGARLAGAVGAKALKVLEPLTETAGAP